MYKTFCTPGNINQWFIEHNGLVDTDEGYFKTKAEALNRIKELMNDDKWQGRKYMR